MALHDSGGEAGGHFIQKRLYFMIRRLKNLFVPRNEDRKVVGFKGNQHFDTHQTDPP